MPSRPIPELLSPAGSLDAARAAIANGADAIYLGAVRFNARDDGAQLTLEELDQACRLAHSRGARVYLTLNTLIKPGELTDALGLLGDCVDRGIDAVIVQDIGLIRLIRRVYPTLEIHGSTQMTVHDSAGAAVLEKLGVHRVVLARENTLEDIRAIRAAVPGYPDTFDAFKRMFERDKDELRELGIPLETGTNSPDDEVGYRISRQAYMLPEIRLEPDEAAVLGLAARVWHRAELAGAAAGALLKLRAAGIDAEETTQPGIEPRLRTGEASFGALWEAVRDGRPVTFAYRAAGRSGPAHRRLEPWGVVNRHGRWYVAGHDLDRAGVRVFRLSRIDGLGLQPAFGNLAHLQHSGGGHVGVAEEVVEDLAQVIQAGRLPRQEHCHQRQEFARAAGRQHQRR